MKKILNLKNLLVPLLGLGFVSNAFANTSTFNALTSAVDYSSAQAAILTVLAALAGFYIVWKGGAYILSSIKRG